MAKLAVQLYSLRSEAEKGFVPLLEKVADIGYDGVEYAGYFGTSAADLAAALRGTGLVSAAAHVPLEQIAGDIDAVIRYHAAIGCDYIVCPYWRCENAEGYKRLAGEFNAYAKRLAAEGMTFGYHNHGHEFEDFGGKTGMDILMEETDPALVKFQLDVYWIKYVGIDPVQYIRQHLDRVRVVHLKDMLADTDKSFTEVGTGIIDMPGVVKAATPAAQWFTVEQDVIKLPPLESVAISLVNCRKWIK